MHSDRGASPRLSVGVANGLDRRRWRWQEELKEIRALLPHALTVATTPPALGSSDGQPLERGLEGARRRVHHGRRRVLGLAQREVPLGEHVRQFRGLEMTV